MAVDVEQALVRVVVIDVRREGSRFAALVPDVARPRTRSASLEREARRHAAAGAVRALAGHLLDSAPSDVVVGRRCPSCGGDHGPPSVVGTPWRLSVAHSGDRAVVALAQDHAVGVDVEVLDRSVDAVSAALGRAADTTPATVLRRWCRIEAILKADGRGLLVDPLAVSLDDAERRVRAVAGHPVVGSVRELDVGPGHLAALAVLGVTDLDVRVVPVATILPRRH